MRSLSEPFTTHGQELVIGASVGIAVSGPTSTVDELLLDADRAMYTAKAAGRGRFERY